MTSFRCQSIINVNKNFLILATPGEVSCGSCYEKSKEELGGTFCPLDGGKINDSLHFTRPDKSLAREISKIQVKCYYEKCKWKGALNDINVRKTSIFI